MFKQNSKIKSSELSKNPKELIKSENKNHLNKSLSFNVEKDHEKFIKSPEKKRSTQFDSPSNKYIIIN